MLWWIAAVGAVLVAVLAGVADWRRQRRADLDRVGLVNWPSVQMFALIGAAACVFVATHG
jgi:hypothetical protein